MVGINTDSDPLETGSKNDGKGSIELNSMSNAEAAKQLQLASNERPTKGKEQPLVQEQIITKQKAKSDKPFFKLKSVKKARKKAHTEWEKKVSESHKSKLELKDKVNDTKREHSNTSTKIKAVQEFLELLPSDVREEVVSQMRQQIDKSSQENKKYQSNELPTDFSKPRTKESIRERIEKKRGAYRERQTALSLAKKAAEKARQMVKAVKERVLRKLKPQKEQPHTEYAKSKNMQREQMQNIKQLKEHKNQRK